MNRFEREATGAPRFFLAVPGGQKKTGAPWKIEATQKISRCKCAGYVLGRSANRHAPRFFGAAKVRKKFFSVYRYYKKNFYYFCRRF